MRRGAKRKSADRKKKEEEEEEGEEEEEEGEEAESEDEEDRSIHSRRRNPNKFLENRQGRLKFKHASSLEEVHYIVHAPPAYHYSLDGFADETVEETWYTKKTQQRTTLAHLHIIIYLPYHKSITRSLARTMRPTQVLLLQLETHTIIDSLKNNPHYSDTTTHNTCHNIRPHTHAKTLRL